MRSVDTNVLVRLLVRDDDAQARAAEAFARLDLALGNIERTDLPAPLFTGDLRAMHPAVTDLADLDDVVGRAGRDMVERASDSAGAIYASLPTQLIHGDFSFGKMTRIRTITS